MSRLRNLTRQHGARAVIAAGLVIAVVGVGVTALPITGPSDQSEPGETVPPELEHSAANHGEQDTAGPFSPLLDPPPPPPARTEPIEYRISEGDSLLTISEQFGLRLDTLVSANGLENPNLIVAGQALRIPPRDGLLYRVQPGDALRAIADRFGVDMATAAAANGIDDPDQLPVGVELFLPDARAPISDPAEITSAPPDEVAPRESEARPAPDPSPQFDSILASSWLRVTVETALLASTGGDARRLHALPAGAAVERAGEVVNGRVPVRDPGDGRTRQAMTGWVDAGAVQPGRPPGPRDLPRSYPLPTRMDIAHIFVPYRTQLDGSPWAAANCGPSALGMVLEGFGIQRSSAQLRSETLAAQGIYGNNVGTLLTALAQVGERHGIRPLDLFEGDQLKRWSLDDVRAHVRAGHPVIAQVYYAQLPGRERVAAAPDHYIVITGAVDDGFLYNDSIDSDGIGWDRVISAERLRVAMDASDKRYRYAAFAAARAGS